MISAFFVSPFIIFKFDEDNIAFMQAHNFLSVPMFSLALKFKTCS